MSVFAENARKRPALDHMGGEPTNKRPYFNNSSGKISCTCWRFSFKYAYLFCIISGHNNRTLIVKKIPPMLNNITKLNEHFAKFGAINNIQVSELVTIV